MIHAFHRAAAVAGSVLVLALAGCGGPRTDTDGESTAAPPPPSPTPSPTATLPEAADGTDLDACYDGECEILVTEPVDIPVDPDVHGFDTLSVTAIEDELVTVEVIVPGGFASVNVGIDGHGIVQGVRVDAVAITEDGAVLSIAAGS